MSTKSFLTLALAFLGATATTASVHAQTPRILLQEGDLVLAAGEIKSFAKVAITDNGLSFVEALTDFDDNDRDTAILRNGFLALQEGTTLSDPEGGSIKSWKDIAVNAVGNQAWPFTIRGVPNGSNEGLFWNTKLLALKGAPVGLPPFEEVNYLSFKSAKINESNQILCMVQLAGMLDTLQLFEVDDAGNVTDHTILLAEDDPFPPLGDIAAIGNTVHATAINANGDWIAQIKTDDAADEDTLILVNGVVQLREGDPDPTPDSDLVFVDMGNPEVGLNDFGEWVTNSIVNDVGGGVTGGRQMIVKNGESFLRAGDVFPAISPHEVRGFRSAPVVIGNSGDVFYYMQTTNPDTNADAAFFRNYQTILRKGEFLGGRVINGIGTSSHAFYVSPNGRFFITEVKLESDGETIVMVDFGTVVPVPGCAGNTGTLELVAGSANIASSVTFAMDNGQAIGATPFLWFATQPAVPGSDCGIEVAAGELLIGKRIVRLLGTPWGGDPVLINAALPNDLSLLDLEFWGQGGFVDIAGILGAERILLTNGIRMEIGAP